MNFNDSFVLTFIKYKHKHFAVCKRCLPENPIVFFDKCTTFTPSGISIYITQAWSLKLYWIWQSMHEYELCTLLMGHQTYLRGVYMSGLLSSSYLFTALKRAPVCVFCCCSKIWYPGMLGPIGFISHCQLVPLPTRTLF